MRKWEATLRRDYAAWEDYKAWLQELAHNELEGMMNVSGDNLAYLKGKIVGIRTVFTAATANEREENQRVRAG